MSGEGVLMVIIGGANVILGPFVGAAVFVVVKQALNLSPMSTTCFLASFLCWWLRSSAVVSLAPPAR